MKRIGARYSSILILGLMLPAIARAAPPAPGVARLAALGRLWGAVKFLHPWLAYKNVDWDDALLAAIPKVEAAKNPDEYAQAVQRMLAAIGDPATHTVTVDAGYRSTIVADRPELYRPSPPTMRRRYAFITGPQSALPEVAMALHAAGEAVLISVGRPSPDGAEPQKLIPLGEGWDAVMLTEELADPAAARPDRILPASASSASAFSAALALLRGGCGCWRCFESGT